MRTSMYPDVAAHAKEHEEFIALLKLFDASALRNPPSLEMVELLRKWLEQHFIGDDRQYAEFVQTALRRKR